MNQHLNIFRYYNESNSSEFIENNLSRAFAICLENDPLFFSKYIQSIVDKDDYDYLFNHYEDSSAYYIDLQVNTNSLESSGLKKVYAVAMTADRDLNMSDFLSLKPSASKDINLTDVIITIKDIAIVIEVKRNKFDCKQQLFDQIAPLIGSGQQLSVVPVNFSWKHTMVLMEQVSNLMHLRGGKSSMLNDFIALAEIRYPYWFSSRPFNQLPPLSYSSQKSVHARNLRLKQIINHSTQKILDYSDRMAIGINFGWASEIIPFFQQHLEEDYIVFTIWPGNTKDQGYRIYDKPLNWAEKKSLMVGDKVFELDLEYHIKFCHFNKFVTSLDFGDEQLLKPLNTAYNFYNKSGKWHRKDWHEFELLLDEHLKPEFNWREKCGFDKHFINTDRNYFTVSLGFMVDLYVPYKVFQDLDTDLDNYLLPSGFIDQLVDAYSNLLD
ncbi:hypothetical protein SAMN04488511_119111 [Pedobacter suwonensis]|uniref:Uncharacterized protein n=1 Tax=Pedobacter suwonensis TaxID=332999 RepID=A0A1I0U390_9SPHI|nr:hypothetical protein [Pedobacter suwonensis]SFA58571.1 hypothetical protein SAMN04488511_119111 [Pedobacter suwonensis]